MRRVTASRTCLSLNGLTLDAVTKRSFKHFKFITSLYVIALKHKMTAISGIRKPNEMVYKFYCLILLCV